jgi:hypothetical protein
LGHNYLYTNIYQILSSLSTNSAFFSSGNLLLLPGIFIHHRQYIGKTLISDQTLLKVAALGFSSPMGGCEIPRLSLIHTSTWGGKNLSA